PPGIDIKTSETLRGGILSADHRLEMESTGQGYRVVAYAPTMENFTSNSSTVFTLKLIADDTFTEGTLTIGGQIIATAGGERSRPADVTYTLRVIPPTAITDVDDASQPSETYSLDGLPIHQLQRGKVYIMGNKKVLIK
ncbi:MAG: hypothetical protein HUK03_03485, partial [Bacteroidaceae bacterium]|nr:hypothetical protein [Bacteroidaceae bacterium]